jgi:opacity protein-like surface antigen
MNLKKLASIVALIFTFSTFITYGKEGVYSDKQFQNSNDSTQQVEKVYFGYNPLAEIYAGYQWSPNLATGGKFNVGTFSYEATGEIFYHRNYINKYVVPYIGAGVGLSIVDVNGNYIYQSLKNNFPALIPDDLTSFDGVNILVKLNSGLEFNFDNNVGVNLGIQYKMLNVLQITYPVFQLGVHFRY